MSQLWLSYTKVKQALISLQLGKMMLLVALTNW